MSGSGVSLENRVGALAVVVPKFQDDSWRTSAELMTERRTNPSLRDQWFYPNNYALYRIERGEVVLYFGGKESNFIFKHVNEAAGQLWQEWNYVPSEIDIVLAMKYALWINLADLQLQKCDTGDTSYFEIDTRDHETILNPS